MTETETIIWEDKKRSILFGLPLSFTKYQLNNYKYELIWVDIFFVL